MTLRRIATLALLLAGFAANAQYMGEPYSPFYLNTGYPATGSLTSATGLNLQSGAIFNSGIGGGSLFSTYMAPAFSRELGKKFTVVAGAVLTNTTYSDVRIVNGEGIFRPTSGNLTTFKLYAAGTYRVNEKMTVTGSAFKTINPAFNSRLNPAQLNMDARGMSFGVGYQVGENVHIGAEIRYQQGNGNLFTPYGIQGNSPFMYNGMNGF